MRTDVIAELTWDPRIDASRIEVTVIGGTVLLRGAVRTYAEKCRAEENVKHVQGVRRVRNELDVRLTIGDYRTDTTLERVASEVIDSLASMPAERPKVTVQNGWVTLDGEAGWAFQSRLAEEALRDVAGIRGITNRIKVAPLTRAEDLKMLIESALRRRGESQIQVLTKKGRITLRGAVRSCVERDALVDLAWSARGVTAVDDQLVIQP